MFYWLSRNKSLVQVSDWFLLCFDLTMSSDHQESLSPTFGFTVVVSRGGKLDDCTPDVGNLFSFTGADTRTQRSSGSKPRWPIISADQYYQPEISIIIYIYISVRIII